MFVDGYGRILVGSKKQSRSEMKLTGVQVIIFSSSVFIFYQVMLNNYLKLSWCYFVLPKKMLFALS